ncbi:hypothetical protein [Actinomadura rugatobispora]|uniref:Secreted protein n=1 Tax=Actinomadura rugatobispora TaxID=1994 RepID=A0ABW1ABM1_9ACTN|nr:hypothetical protein GCM10010200_053510 [Actinomadura rugatobispora]
MRLLSVTAVGAIVVAAGLAAPASGEEAAAGDGVRVEPQVARPGTRVKVVAPKCGRAVESTAFTEAARLSGRTGRVHLKRGIGAGTYPVVVQCGDRAYMGRLTVSTERSWPSLLPGALNPQMARAQGEH